VVGFIPFSLIIKIELTLSYPLPRKKKKSQLRSTLLLRSTYWQLVAGRTFFLR
jgi:hypothetical protein